MNLVSQFLHSPTEEHFSVVKRNLRYVKGTIHFGLSYSRGSETFLVGCSDADWARCIETRRSTYVFLGGGMDLVSWSVNKQPTMDVLVASLSIMPWLMLL